MKSTTIDRCMRWRLAILAALAGLSSAALALPASECPQPRFTGKAPAEYYDRTNPLPLDTNVAEAERIYRGSSRGVSCATCHGVKGDGRGEMAELFDPRPRNFRCEKTVRGIPDGQLFWIIRFGSPGTSMPGHPDLSDTQVWKMVLYLHSFLP